MKVAILYVSTLGFGAEYLILINFEKCENPFK